MNNKVSIWLGRFDSEEQLNDYVEEQYNEDGDILCPFYSDFKIEYLDSDLRDLLFHEPLNKSVLSNASYAASFIDAIDADLSQYNAVILAYDFEYSGDIDLVGGLHFYAVLPYNKE